MRPSGCPFRASLNISGSKEVPRTWLFALGLLIFSPVGHCCRLYGSTKYFHGESRNVLLLCHAALILQSRCLYIMYNDRRATVLRRVQIFARVSPYLPFSLGFIWWMALHMLRACWCISIRCMLTSTATARGDDHEFEVSGHPRKTSVKGTRS